MPDHSAPERVAGSRGIGLGLAPEGRRAGEEVSRHASARARAAVLQGKHILIVEDEALLAYTLADELNTLGCTAIGPFTRLATAMQAVRREEFDAAILDVNLSGEFVYPLADELVSRGIPFVFLTGYARSTLPDRLQTCPHLMKPYSPVLLERELARMLKRQ